MIAKQKAEREELLNAMQAKGIKRWDYKHLRLDYKGRGITQEINLLDIDGERVRGWSDNFSRCKSRFSSKRYNNALLQFQKREIMKDDFKEFVDNYKKDPEKVKQRKQAKLERKKNKPKKNLFNFRFWEWMG